MQSGMKQKHHILSIITDYNHLSFFKYKPRYV